MTTYPISHTEWNVLRSTSPETLVVINVVDDSKKNMKPGNKIIDADDWCNKWKEAQWVKRESEENFRSPLPDARVCAGSSRPWDSARHVAAGEADEGRATAINEADLFSFTAAEES